MPRSSATHVDRNRVRPQPSPAGGHAGSYVFSLLLALRILNALTTRTFFQPDEYFQALEPAWQMVFGEASGAWITWEWKSQLRSSLHPALFAGVLALSSALADACSASPSTKADVLVAAPKITQAVFAASTDYFSWRLAEQAYGRGSRAAWASVTLAVCSPWQWFCSTRSLSNCLETTLTSAALVWWPWPWVAQRGSPTTFGDRPHLSLSLVAAAFACVLRPTNLLVWICISLPTLWQASARERHALVQSAVLYGGGVLALSAVADRIYYRVWTLPPLRFVHFNIARSLAVFYGTNRGDYYVTEGLPLLLTTALPFAVWGMYASLRRDGSNHPNRMLSILSLTALVMVLALSLISHKEVRFIYPLLPILHVLAASPLSTFFHPPLSLPKRVLLALLLSFNFVLAIYASQVHQRGVIDVLHHLRARHQQANPNAHVATAASANTTSVAFLMPCHSTPWRSHLVFPSIDAWALTCEPPLDVPLAARDAYRDEADRFYVEDGPARWLQLNMQALSTVARGAEVRERQGEQEVPPRRPWPTHLVFFAQLEEQLRDFLRGTRYVECWRGFNSHWHDDWRRRGDVVVWCLDGEQGGGPGGASGGDSVAREL